MRSRFLRLRMSFSENRYSLFRDMRQEIDFRSAVWPLCAEAWISQHHSKWISLETAAPASGSLHLDSCRLDDRPPLLDLGLVVSAMRLRRLLVAREDALAEIGELRPHACVR